MWCFNFLLFLSYCLTVYSSCNCSVTEGVFLTHRNQRIPNNSYVLYDNIRYELQSRLYCHTDNSDCCSSKDASWFLPNGELILGGYEYDDVTVGVFATALGFGRIGLYPHYSPQHRGRFKCIITDARGNNCTLYANIVDEIPTVIAQPLSKKVAIGSNVTFSFQLSVGSLATYRWQKNNRYVVNGSIRYQGSETPLLVISNVQEEDNGYYRCIIDTFVSDAAELLTVSASIAVSDSMDNVNIISGRNYDLSFNTTSPIINSLTGYRWQKDGRSTYRNQKYRGTSTRTLTLINVESSDEGTYSLSATDQNGDSLLLVVSISVVTLSVVVNASDRPQIGIQWNLTCSILQLDTTHTNSSITYQWYKDKTLLSKTSMSTLSIQSLAHADAGGYVCEVSVISKDLYPSQLTRKSAAYRLCFTLDIRVTHDGITINNNSVVYSQDISEQVGIYCYTNYFNISCLDSDFPKHSASNFSGQWYFPNGALVPLRSKRQTGSTVFAQKRPGLTGLYRIGQLTQTGKYYCAATDALKFYVYIIAGESKTSFNTGYLVWAICSSMLVLLLGTTFCICHLAKVLRRKVPGETHSSNSPRTECSSSHDYIDTGINFAYDKALYRGRKQCEQEDDYEEVSFPQKDD